MLWPRKDFHRQLLPDIRLEGRRVTLMPPQLGHWSAWAQVRQRNQSYLKEYEPLWPDNCLTRQFFMKRLERQVRDWRSGRGYAFLIFDSESGELIGGINVNSVCRGAAQFASLGYWIDRDLQGRGLMSESLRLVIKFCFEQVKLHRLNASCMPRNESSIRLLKKLGFKEEGFAKAYIQIGGCWEDHNLYGLLAEEFQPGNTAPDEPAENKAEKDGG